MLAVAINDALAPPDQQAGQGRRTKESLSKRVKSKANVQRK